MIRAEFAPGYRKRAELWRRRAAHIRENSATAGPFNAEQVAQLWEEVAHQLETDADDIESADRVSVENANP